MTLIPPPPTLPPGSRVWAYLRDSGGESQENSVTQQQTAMAQFCATHGLLLEKLWADVARSGTTDVGREQFAAMINAIGQRPPAGLLYWATSRFARNEDDAVFYRAIIRRKGVILHSLTEPIPTGPAAKIIEAAIDFAAAESSRQNSAAVKRGQESIFRAGFSTGGFPPRGYVAVPVVIGTKRNGQPRTVDKWETDPALWDVCKLAWELRATGASLREIEQATAGKVYTSRNCWTTFFRNESYLGIGKCGELRLEGHHPAMIDRATWEAVQALNPARREAHASYNRAPSLLSGLARCGACGAPMNKQTSGKNKWASYICARRHRDKAACTNAPISRALVDNAVVGAVLGQILTDQGAALIEQAQAELSDTTTAQQALLAAQRELAAVERQIQTLLDLAENFGSQAAAARLHQRETERARLLAEIETARAHLSAAAFTIAPDVLQAVFAEISAKIKSATTSGDVMALRRVLTEVITRVDIGREELSLHYSYQAFTRLGEVPPRLPTPEACFKIKILL